MAGQPDVIVLILDTLRADHLSCYDYPVETTPYLDALAAESTRFRFAVSPAHWTIPSHTSMFTGVYPSQHMTIHASSVIPAALPTLAERLLDAGYYTAAFCNNPLVGVVNNGLRRGFLDFFNYSGLLTSRPNRAGTHTGALDHVRQAFKRRLTSIVTAMQDAFARSDTLLDVSFAPFMVPLWQTALSFKGNTARALHDAARLHIERRGVERDQPIFSFINLMGTHMPYHPPPHFVKRFAPHVLHDTAARRYVQRFNSDAFGWLAPLSTALDEYSRKTLDGMYSAEVASEDEQVGAFLQQLRSSGRLDQTVLIVAADHGEHLGEKQLVGHSMTAYNELVHVPLIIRDPGGELPRGTTIESFVSTRRIFHTVLAAAGAATAEEQQLTLARNAGNDPEDGLAFAEAAPAANVLRLLQRHAPHLIRERNCDLPRSAAFSDAYKIIKTGDDQFELYDVIADPGETINLYDDLPYQAALMQEKLEAFLHRFTDTDPESAATDAEDDPEILHRLRDLGYVE